MPTVVVLDTSLSMLRLCQPPAKPASTEDAAAAGHTHLEVAKRGIDLLLEHLEHHYRLEHAALITFSSAGKEETLCTFDRDMPSVRAQLETVEAADQSHVLSGLGQAQNLIQGTWGTSSNVPVNVILVTDGALDEPMLEDRVWQHLFPMAFKGKLTVVAVCHPRDKYLAQSRPSWDRLFSLTGLEDTRLLVPESDLTLATVEALFKQIVETDYREYVGSLHLGDEVSGKVTLCPPPKPYKAERDFEIVEAEISDALDIKGFFRLADVSSPPVVSRHLVLPWLGRPATDEDGRAPSLCVFLHGSLKMESLCALVEVAPCWFGLLFACADGKKKSSLMLSLLEPGPKPVPWIGDLTTLGPLSGLNSTNQEPFPLKVPTKPSYSSSCVVWIKPSSLHSDMQKLLRHARKMPEKTAHFYKELNRMKRAALCIGYTELLDGLASTFDRELSLLPASGHPQCRLQLTHAAKELRGQHALDVGYVIEQLPFNYVKGQ